MPKHRVKVPAGDLKRQANVLGPLHARTGLDYTEGANAAGMSYDMYRRYVTGKTLLPSSYYAAMARALDVPIGQLRDDLIPDPAQGEPFDCADELEKLRPELPGLVEQAVRERSELPDEAQRALVRGFIYAVKARRRAHERDDPERSIAENRADYTPQRTGT